MSKNEAGGGERFITDIIYFLFLVINLDPKLIRNNKKTLLLTRRVRERVQQIVSRGAVCNRTCLLTHWGFFLTLWWKAWRSFGSTKARGLCQGCQSGWSCWVHPAEAFRREHTWRWEGAFVQALLGSLVSWLEAKSLPARRAAAPRCLLWAHHPPCPAKGCRSLQRLPAWRDVLVIAPSFEAPWHLQTQDCPLKNREGEKCGD